MKPRSANLPWMVSCAVLCVLASLAPATARPRAAAPAAAAEPLASSLVLAPAAEPGTRLAVFGTLVDRGGFPVGGAEIHVYQADARGCYTPLNPMDEPNARLSGRLRTDASGRFELRTIRPGHYPRTVKLDGIERRIPAHVHMDIAAEGHVVKRLQMVFADDSLLNEPYWKDWVAKLGQPVLRPRPVGRGTAGSITIAIE